MSPPGVVKVGGVMVKGGLIVVVGGVRVAGGVMLAGGVTLYIYMLKKKKFSSSVHFFLQNKK